MNGPHDPPAGPPGDPPPGDRPESGGRDGGEPAPGDAWRTQIEGQHLELSFPCSWTYGVIGRDAERLRAAVASVVGGSEHSLEPSHESRAGKYVSMHLELVVENDERRLEIFRRLHGHTDILYVL